MAKPLMDVAQELLTREDPKIPPSVSNRLLAGMIISSRDQLKAEINGNTVRIENNTKGILANSSKYIDLLKSDKKWGAAAIVLAALISCLVAAFGG